MDTFEPEPEIPLADISADLLAVNSELQSAEQELFAMLDQLTGTTAEAEAELTAFKAALKGE
ncbi:hypothetical protein ACVUTO_23665 [Escherichia coli]